VKARRLSLVLLLPLFLCLPINALADTITASLVIDKVPPCPLCQPIPLDFHLEGTITMIETAAPLWRPAGDDWTVSVL